MADPFVAEIRVFPFNFAPKGWAWCDGQLLPLAQNTALFSLLGTTYGGDGATNFGLPNLMGRSPMQWGQGPGLTSRDLGETGGQATVTLQPTEIPAHAHALRGAVDTAETGTPALGLALGTASAPVYGPPSDPVAMAGEAIAPVGGDQPHQNRQPYLTFYFAIALQGVYPPRS
jgi:microcystin-dependent protein